MPPLTRTFAKGLGPPDGSGWPVRAGRRRLRVRRRGSRWLNLSLWIGLLATGCEQQVGPTDAATASTPSRIERIVSLSPAMTTMLVDLGRQDLVVGRTPWCRGVDNATVVGTLEGPDAELLLVAKPDLVLVQPPASGLDPSILELQRRVGFELIAQRLDGVDDITEVVQSLADRGVVSASMAQAWGDRTDFIRTAVNAAKESSRADDPSIDLVMLYSVDPFGLVGRGTYLDEVMIAAGGRNLVRRPGWIEAGVEELISLEPPVVVLVLAKPDDGRRLATLRSLPWKTMPRFEVLLSPDAFEPSTRIYQVVANLRALLDDSTQDAASEVDP